MLIFVLIVNILNMSTIDRVKLEWPLNFIEGEFSALGIDTEYAPDNALLTLGLANLNGAIAHDVTTDLIEGRQYGILEIKWLIGHSVMGDIDHLVKLGLAKPEWVDGSKVIDTLLCARMVDENRGKGEYGLETVLKSYFPEVQEWKAKTEAYDKTDATKWPSALRIERCRLDAWASAVLAERLARTIPSDLRQFTTRIAATIHRIGLAGACVDLDVFEQMGAELYQQVERAKHELEVFSLQMGMESFFPTKDADLRMLLYDKLGFEVGKTTKKTGKASVDRFTIQKFDHPIIKTLLDFNKAHKLHSTWYGTPNSKRQSLKQLVVPYQASQEGTFSSQLGWLPFHINPLGARTGRRSSERPNSQNWPKSVRKIIVSRWRGGRIGAFDYRALEPFILSWLAQDDKLYAYFSQKGGYLAIAKDLLHKTVEKGSLDYKVVKIVFLATTYNQLPYTLANTLVDQLGTRLHHDWKEHVKQCGVLIRRLLSMFPSVQRFMQARRSEVERSGQVVSATGRVRHLSYPLEKEFETEREWKKAKKRVENQAINFPVQEFASAVTGSALIDLEKALLHTYNITLLELHASLLTKDYPKMPLIINEVHDELTLDLPDTQDVELIKETMRKVPTLRKLCPSFDIPLDVEATVGPAWGVSDDPA